MWAPAGAVQGSGESGRQGVHILQASSPATWACPGFLPLEIGARDLGWGLLGLGTAQLCYASLEPSLGTWDLGLTVGTDAHSCSSAAAHRSTAPEGCGQRHTSRQGPGQEVTAYPDTSCSQEEMRLGDWSQGWCE